MRFPDPDHGGLGSKPRTEAGFARSVLMVDREAKASGLAAQLLSKERAQLELVADLQRADELRGRLHFDLILLYLPGQEAATIEWIGQLRQQAEIAPIVLLTEGLDMPLMLAALRAGVTDLVDPSGGGAALAEALARVLGRPQRAGRSGISEAVQAGGEIFASDGIVGASSSMSSLCDVVKRVAVMPTTVLIQGESGTGKELVARALHRLSGRTGNFAAINCGAITAELFESELFGHTKGAFTGAAQSREGLFSYADGGTVLLDEIGEMPLVMQAKLLRVLEQRSIRPVGSNREVAVDVRVVAATNRSLADRVADGGFREDLFHRLNVVPLRVPSLRERPDDIPLLGRFFLEEFSNRMGTNLPRIGDAEWLRLQEYSWPGNVRELRNTMERCVLLNRMPSSCLEGVLDQVNDAAEVGDDLTLESMERRHVRAVLDLCGGNKSEAARRLAISRKTLERKLRRWG